MIRLNSKQSSKFLYLSFFTDRSVTIELQLHTAPPLQLFGQKKEQALIDTPPAFENPNAKIDPYDFVESPKLLGELSHKQAIILNA